LLQYYNNRIAIAAAQCVRLSIWRNKKIDRIERWQDHAPDYICAPQFLG